MVEELQCGDTGILEKVMFKIGCVNIIKHTKELLLESLVCLAVPPPYLPVQIMSLNDLVVLLIREKLRGEYWVERWVDWRVEAIAYFAGVVCRTHS
eukprot:1020100-Ditylum_brightwellii.AAC.1